EHLANESQQSALSGRAYPHCGGVWLQPYNYCARCHQSLKKALKVSDYGAVTAAHWVFCALNRIECLDSTCGVGERTWTPRMVLRQTYSAAFAYFVGSRHHGRLESALCMERYWLVFVISGLFRCSDSRTAC